MKSANRVWKTSTVHFVIFSVASEKTAMLPLLAIPPMARVAVLEISPVRIAESVWKATLEMIVPLSVMNK